MNAIHSRIRALRETRGLSQEDIAKALGVTYQAVQQWEREGGTQPRRHRLHALAKMLNTSVEWLETGREPSHYGQAAPDERSATEPLQTHYAFQWPFKLINIERIRALSEREIGYVEGRLIAAVEECERTGAANTPQAGKSA